MRKVSRSRLSAGCAGLCLMLTPATAFGQVTEQFPAPEGGYTSETSIALRGRAIGASNRMYMQTRPGAKICDIDEYRAALAEMERAAAEFHRLAEAVAETGAPAGLNPGYFSFNDRDIQGLLKRWRTLLPECERASAVGQPISEEVLSSLYPPASAPQAAPASQPRGDILDGMAPQRATLGAAIAGCDKAAFKAAKNQLLEELGKLLTRFPGNIHLLAERRRIEETQLPVPCPPESRTSPPVTQASGPQDPPLEGHDDILDEIGDDIGTTPAGFPPRPEPATSPAVDPPPPRTAPPVAPRKPEEIHVPPKPVAQLPELPPSLETMIRETDSRERYLELRRMAEPGALRVQVPKIESMLDQVDDEEAVKAVRSCGTALQKIPPPMAAAVLAAEGRATEKPEHWFPGPDLSDTRAAAEACAEVDKAAERVAALTEEWRDAMMADLFEKQFGIRPQDVRPTATVKQELDAAEDDADGYLWEQDEEEIPFKLDPVSSTFLDLHNQERAEVGVPPLQWDPALAASARAYAIKLTSAGQLVHSSREGRKTVRENLLQNLPGGRTPTQMIGVWTAEKSKFKPGIFPDVSTTGNWYDIGHYTQMVWETTTRVGCAINGDARFEWLVCHYSPPGNRDGTAVGLPSAPQPRHVVAGSPTMPQLRGVAGQDGIAPANSTTTTGPPPPPPPPTARDDSPDGDEARHPLNGYFAEALARHTAAVDCGDKAAAAAEMAKMRYALDELKKRLKAAKKAGPYSAVKPDDVQKQIDDMEAKIRSAELRPGPGACPPMPQPRGVAGQANPSMR